MSKRTRIWIGIILLVVLANWLIWSKAPSRKSVQGDRARWADTMFRGELVDAKDTGYIHTSFHTTKDIRFADGTYVIMNSMTGLSYTLDSFCARSIQCNGELYVSVPSTGRAVVLSDSSIGQLTIPPGSTINICNYRRDDFWRVSSMKGSAELLRKGHLLHIGEREELTYDGYAKSLDSDMDQQKASLDADAWLVYSPQMKNYPLRVILNSLERCYGINIVSEDSALNRDHYTITWVYSRGPDKVLEYLANTGHLTFKWIGEKQYFVSPVN